MYAKLFLAVIILVPFSTPSYAGQAEVRAVARVYECNPIKIEVIKTKLGTPSQTVYRVDCNMPKQAGDGGNKSANALIISCEDTLCTMIRAVKK